MDDDRAFLSAIGGRPADGTVRLAYADWLDEHGEPAKAEFLRITARLSEVPADDPSGAALRERERDLRAGLPPRQGLRTINP